MFSRQKCFINSTNDYFIFYNPFKKANYLVRLHKFLFFEHSKRSLLDVKEEVIKPIKISINFSTITCPKPKSFNY